MATGDNNTQLQEIADKLSNLKVKDLAKFKTLLEDMWGVTTSAGMPMMAMPVAGGEAATTQEATHFKVMLKEFPADKKISIIKVVREVTGTGLKEAKELTEGLPSVLKDSAEKAEAEEIQKKIQEAGGKVELQGL